MHSCMLRVELKVSYFRKLEGTSLSVAPWP